MFAISLRRPVRIYICFVSQNLPLLEKHIAIKQAESLYWSVQKSQISSMLPGKLSGKKRCTVPSQNRKRKLGSVLVELFWCWYRAKLGSVTEFWFIYCHPETANYQDHIMVCGRALPMSVCVCATFLTAFGSHMAVKMRPTLYQHPTPTHTYTHMHTSPCDYFKVQV